MNASERPPSKPPHQELSRTPDKVRRYLLPRLQSLAQAAGLVITIGAEGCLTSNAGGSHTLPERQTAAVQRNGVGQERKPTVTEQEAYLHQILGPTFSLQEEDPRRNDRPERYQLPEIRGAEYAGFQEGTLTRFLLTYPRFMTRRSNMHRLRFSIDERPMPTEYGPRFAGQMQAGYAPRSGPSYASELVILRQTFVGATALSQTRNFAGTVAHEMGHLVDEEDIDTDRREDRIRWEYELVRIACDPAWAIPFRESNDIDNPDQATKNHFKAREYHAEAIEFALTTPLANGESWYTKMVDRLMITYPHINRQQAERTASYAIGYILHHDPSYNHAQAYAARERETLELAEERKSNAAHATELMQEAGELRNIIVRVQPEMYRSLCSINDELESLSTSDILDIFEREERVRYFLLHPESPTAQTRSLESLPSYFRTGPGQRATQAWREYVNTLREFFQFRLDHPNLTTTEARTTQTRVDTALTHFNQELRRSGVRPSSRLEQVFSRWILIHLRECTGTTQ